MPDPEDRDRQDLDGTPMFVGSRHERVYNAVQRSRQGRIPTWVYAVTLALVIAAWIAWIVLG